MKPNALSINIVYFDLDKINTEVIFDRIFDAACECTEDTPEDTPCAYGDWTAGGGTVHLDEEGIDQSELRWYLAEATSDQLISELRKRGVLHVDSDGNTDRLVTGWSHYHQDKT